MRKNSVFIKSSIIDGIVFLVPIVILVAIIGKAFEIMTALATPLANKIPIDSIGGFATANLIAIAVIVVFCFLAGLVARTTLANKFVQLVESKLLSKLPVYAFVKNMTEHVAGAKTEGLTPILSPALEGWRVAFEIERIDGGNVAAYLPGAPNSWSGSVCIPPDDSKRPLDIPLSSLIERFEGFGKGSNELLRHKL